MKALVLKLASLSAILFVASTVLLAAQDPPPTDKPPADKPATTSTPSRLTIEVTGGDTAVPVENASVYLKYVEEHAIKKDKKIELNVKTNREGLAHVAEAPLGRALVQIVADGWKPYGRWYDITDPKQVIKIRLEKPPKWY
jgi:Flp pilus assembly protein TadG